MCGHWLFAAVVVAVVLWPTAAAPADPVRVNDLKDNVQVRLVAAKVAPPGARAAMLVAKFETLGDAKEILIEFGGGDSTHKRTLESLIKGCLEGPVHAGETKVKDGVEVIFSVPKDGILGYGARGETYERCYLVSLKLGDKK